MQSKFTDNPKNKRVVTNHKKIPKIGDIIPVHSYKHNGKIHRTWDQMKILESSNKQIIGAGFKTLVTESDGRKWKTTEPAISYFFQDMWFNVICMLRADGVHFYCNLSSPCLYDNEIIKYIDYDLDVKVIPDYSYKILDESEYKRHKVQMNYPYSVQKILRRQLDVLISMIRKKEGPFAPGFANHWYEMYRKSK